MNFSSFKLFFQKNPKKKLFIIISVLTFFTIVVVLLTLPSKAKFLAKPDLFNLNQPNETANNNQEVLGTQGNNQNQSSPSAKSQPLLTIATPQQTQSPTQPPVLPQPEPPNQPEETVVSYYGVKSGFSPNFSVSPNNTQPGASSNFNLEYGSSSGSWRGIGIRTVVPAGFEITPGSELAQNALVGQGEISAKLENQDSTSKFTAFNQKETQGHKGRWLIKFDNKVYGEKTLFIDGDKNSGHTLILDSPVSLALESPVLAKFTIFANTITNPPTSGNFNWKAEFLFADGILEEKKTVDIK